MRIAHVSDFHVLCLSAVRWPRLLNKRITGWANVRYRRAQVHKTDVARAVLADLREQAVDHFVVTGDLANLSLEAEFEAAARMLDDLLGAPPDRVTMVPGNHDTYTRGAERARRFAQYFASYLGTDLPDLRAEHPSGLYPVVKLRGPIAFIGLSSAVARPPFVASGSLGSAQLAALGRVLEHPEVKKRFPVIAIHHPLHRAGSLVGRLTRGLEDAAELVERLGVLDRGLVLHGHLHGRIHRTIATRTGQLDVIGATSASLVDPDPARRAGYNVYEIDAGGLGSLTTRVYDAASGTLATMPLGEVSAPR